MISYECECNYSAYGFTNVSARLLSPPYSVKGPATGPVSASFFTTQREPALSDLVVELETYTRQLSSETNLLKKYIPHFAMVFQLRNVLQSNFCMIECGKPVSHTNGQVWNTYCLNMSCDMYVWVYICVCRARPPQLATYLAQNIEPFVTGFLFQ